MVLSLLQGNLAQMPAQRDWLGLLFSKTKHCQAGEQIKGHCLVRTEMQVWSSPVLAGVAISVNGQVPLPSTHTQPKTQVPSCPHSPQRCPHCSEACHGSLTYCTARPQEVAAKSSHKAK